MEAGRAAERHRHGAGPRTGDGVCPDLDDRSDPGAPCQRAARVLSAAERQQISRGLAEGLVVRALARALGRTL
jgi:hypothetical protein